MPARHNNIISILSIIVFVIGQKDKWEVKEVKI